MARISPHGRPLEERTPGSLLSRWRRSAPALRCGQGYARMAGSQYWPVSLFASGHRRCAVVGPRGHRHGIPNAGDNKFARRLVTTVAETSRNDYLELDTPSRLLRY